MYAALVAAAGYLPLTLSGEDYLELLPVEWRQINAYGIRIGYRTYDCAELGPWRLQHSGVTARRGLWEVHYDPYDATHVFVRTPDGWVTVPWTHLPMVVGAVRRVHLAPRPRSGRRTGPRRHQRDRGRAGARRPADPRAGRAGDKLSDRIAARTRVAAAAHRPPPRDDAMPPEPGKPADGDDGRPAGDRDSVRDLRCRRRGGAVVNTAGDHRCRGDRR